MHTASDHSENIKHNIHTTLLGRLERNIINMYFWLQSKLLDRFECVHCGQV